MQDIATLPKAKFSLRSPEVFRQRLLNSGLWSPSSPYLKELDSYNWGDLKTRLFFCENEHFLQELEDIFPEKLLVIQGKGLFVCREIFSAVTRPV